MWRLIKAEFTYDRFRILLTLIICTVCFIVIWFGVKWERNRAPMTMLIMLVSSLTVSYSGEMKRNTDKRDRMHVSLPLSLYQIGMGHLIFMFFIWLSTLFIFLISYFIIRVFYNSMLTIPSILQILTLNGLVLIVNAVYLLNRDLGKTFIKKRSQFFISFLWILVYIAALLPFYIVTNFFGLFGESTALQVFLNRLSESPIWFNILGLTLSVISLLVFMRRWSFIDS